MLLEAEKILTQLCSKPWLKWFLFWRVIVEQQISTAIPVFFHNI